MKNILIATLILLIAGCNPEDADSTGGFIKANVDGTLYDCRNFVRADNSGTGYGVRYSVKPDMPYHSFCITFNDKSKIAATPYTFTNNYIGAGVEIRFEYYQQASPVYDDYSANNWSQSTTPTGFTTTITSIEGGVMKGTFSGRLRKYNTNGGYTEKNITNGSFEVPYN